MTNEQEHRTGVFPITKQQAGDIADALAARWVRDGARCAVCAEALTLYDFKEPSVVSGRHFNDYGIRNEQYLIDWFVHGSCLTQYKQRVHAKHSVQADLSLIIPDNLPDRILTKLSYEDVAELGRWVFAQLRRQKRYDRTGVR